MLLKNGIFDGARYAEAHAIGGKITPQIVVLHDTASRTTPGNAARYLQKNPRNVSVHFVVEIDGSWEQQVPVDRRANHAGKSVYRGRAGCNNFSIGIEIVNPGRMTRVNKKLARAWWGQEFDINDYGIEEATTPEHGHGLWMPYTQEQLEAVSRLLEALFTQVDSLQDIVGHWYVSPGRKVDVNPLFPMEYMRNRILGRDDPVDAAAQDNSMPAEVGEFCQIDTQGGNLNMRRWPSFNPNVIGSIPDGTVVPILRSGEFEDELWHLVRYDGREGWIVASYTAPIVFAEEPGFKGAVQ